MHDYGDVCQAITELAVELNAPIGTDDFRVLNKCLDEAIASAVTQYAREQRRSDSDGDTERKNERLPEPIITPTTKGGITGHDERLTCAEVVEKSYLDKGTWDQVQTAALAIFKRGQAVAQRAGLILVDTKYEFGRAPDGKVLLIDEVHTPDSSRFWKADSYAQAFAQGQEPENFDKEFVRLAYVERGYRGDGEPPVMGNDLWAAASQRYIQIYEMLTGQTFSSGDYPVEPRLIQNLQKGGILA